MKQMSPGMWCFATINFTQLADPDKALIKGVSHCQPSIKNSCFPVQKSSFSSPLDPRKDKYQVCWDVKQDVAM